MKTVNVEIPFFHEGDKQKRTFAIRGEILSEILDKLNVKIQGETKERIFGSEKVDLRKDVDVLIDGENISSEFEEETRLEDGTEIKIVKKVSGGTSNEKFLGFDEEQIIRYSRQIVLPEIGGRGQEKLLDSKVLIVGAGALGAPSALYLAGAGVGTIGIVDGDKVDLSNLQRQIIHGTSNIGENKTDSAEERISDLNPEVEVQTYKKRLNKDNIFEVLDEEWDIVLDASDNFPTKFLLNDACYIEGIPLSHAGILRFSGMVTTFLPGKGPCYRCFTPEAPPPDSVPSCQEAGVLGAIPGVIGSIQATEVLKYLLDTGKLLIGRFLIFEGKDMTFEEVKFSPSENCQLCGKKPRIKDLNQVDYGGTCQVRF